MRVSFHVTLRVENGSRVVDRVFVVLPSNLGHVLCCRSWIDRQEDTVAATLQWEIFRWRDGMSIGPPPTLFPRRYITLGQLHNNTSTVT